MLNLSRILHGTLATQSSRFSLTYRFNCYRLTAVNAIQLAMALVANVFLLLNMARRIRFDIAQPVTMVGW